MGKFNRRQWTYLILLYICNLSVFAAVALLPPFYPSLAQSKGATATQFGFVFGIFRLTMGLISPIYGKYMENLGVKFILSSGVFTAAITCILMGFLNMVSGSIMFIGLSFAIQIVSAFGAAAVTNVNSATANKEFPNSSGLAFAIFEIAVGLGNTTGPLIGGYFFELGGYPLPFVVVGGVLVFVALTVVIFLPTDDYYSTIEEPTGKISVLQVFKEPSIVLYIFNVITACYGFGFFLGTLEYLLRPLNLLPLEIGYQFVLNSAIFSFSAWGWGWLCDVKKSSLTVCLTGAVLSFLSFLLIGPAPFINLPFTLLSVMIANILLGVGNAAQVMATFSGVYKEAVACGFPSNLSTFGLIGGIWNCCFSIGCFIGFSTGGILLDLVGFRWASMSVVILQLIAIFLTLLFMCYRTSVYKADKVSKEELYKTNSNIYKQYGSFKNTSRSNRRNSSLKLLLGHE